MHNSCAVIVPTRNRRDRLLRTLRSIQAQTHDDLQIIISDDASTDGTAEAIEALGDDRIVVIRGEAPAGAAGARNRGIAAADARYLAFCDDDDLWVPEKLASQIAVMHEENKRWAFCHSILVADDLGYHSRDRGRQIEAFPHLILIGNQVPGGCSSVVTERALVEEVGVFDPTLSMFADWDLWIRFTAVAPPAMWQAPGVLYVLHEAQMSMNPDTAHSELQRVRAKHEAEMADKGAWTRAQGYDPLDGWILRQLWLSGRWGRALTYFGREPTLRTIRQDVVVTLRLAVERALALRDPMLSPAEIAALERVANIANASEQARS